MRFGLLFYRCGSPIALMDNLSAFHHLTDSHNLSLSIGGQTSAVAFYCKFEPKDLLNACNDLPKFRKGRIYVLQFPTSAITAVLPVLSKFMNKSCTRETQIILTGEAARKNINYIQKTLNKSLVLRDYTLCIVAGFYTFLKNIRDERMKTEFLDHPKYVFLNPWTIYDKYLMVTWNGRVNYLMVKSEAEFERVGQTFLDSDHLMRIVRGCTGVNSFDELIKLAKLSKSYIKLVYSGYEYPAEVELLKENYNILDSIDDSGTAGDRSEIAWTLLWGWLNNIAQLAALYSKIHSIDKVVFVEGSSKDNLCNDIIDISVKFWSQNAIKPLFLRHEGYISAVGALLKNLSQQQKDFNLDNSWEENYFLSSGMYGNEISFGGTNFLQLVLDSVGNILTFCPLLTDPAAYAPDIQNIYVDDEYRAYWLKCMERNAQSACDRIQKEVCDHIVKAMASQYSQQMLFKYESLREKPFLYGNLSMRIILDTCDQCYKELGLIGAYQKVKANELRNAIGLFKERIYCIDKLQGPEKHKELIVSLLVGNLFDWGSTEALAMLNSGQFGFSDAAKKLPSRPWLRDDLDKWIERMQGPPHKRAAIFVDNFGFDLILGILPFTRELLKRGTKVILCSNREPVLNDVTHTELNRVLKDIFSISPTFSQALNNDALTLMEMSKSSCCLDLGFIDLAFAEACPEIDLLVIDGMGRGVHTNLTASFKVDSLVLGVVKDRWLASQLGGSTLATICKFEPATYTV